MVESLVISIHQNKFAIISTHTNHHFTSSFYFY